MASFESAHVPAFDVTTLLIATAEADAEAGATAIGAAALAATGSADVAMLDIEAAITGAEAGATDSDDAATATVETAAEGVGSERLDASIALSAPLCIPFHTNNATEPMSNNKAPKTCRCCLIFSKPVAKTSELERLMAG
jgi:hypothetical protein